MNDALIQLALIWGAVYVAVLAAGKTRLTPVLWFLAVGSVMVNTGLLPVESHPFIEGLAGLGIILIMFSLGFEENTGAFIDSIKRSWGIAFFGAVAPFFTAFFIADYFWDSLAISLMCGLTMTATAVSLTMVSLKSEGLQGSPAATRIMTSAVLDDIASLALVAMLVPMAAGDATVDFGNLIFIASKAISFFLVVAVLGAWLFPHDPPQWVRRIPILGTGGLRQILAFGDGNYATLTIFLLAVCIGLLAHEFGLHPAVGAYMAGLILREEYFRLSGERSSHGPTKDIIESAAYSWIGPVFFVNLGAKLIIDWDIMVSIIPQTVALTLALFVAQVSSAATAARYTSGLDWPQSMMVGFGMLGRAELAFVVMDIAYVQNSILNTEAFYTLMITAFWLNVAVPITISLWKPRLAGGSGTRQ